ncbi:hypothetical protein, partial [Bacteroides heparinolyticus]|uniref:hypothetical protein n=1 Tax=Prevotella heparinolytica TaxID=28113 RepID=UPI00359F524F
DDSRKERREHQSDWGWDEFDLSGNGLHLSKQEEDGRSERLSSLLLNLAVNRCIQGISFRQDAALHLQQKQPPIPKSGREFSER